MSLVLFLFAHQSALMSPSASSLISGRPFINLMCIIEALRGQLGDMSDISELPVWKVPRILHQGRRPPWTCALMPFCLVRSLGLYIRGVEEESRSRKEGLFQEEECIVKINSTDLMDKTFSQSVQQCPLCRVWSVLVSCCVDSSCFLLSVSPLWGSSGKQSCCLRILGVSQTVPLSFFHGAK